MDEKRRKIYNTFKTSSLLLDELANLLTHLIATLSSHQTDGLDEGKRGTSRYSLDMF